ncbi:uncharacterized protein LOC143458971 [Clavelina lepadiformis]|uniref:uncharacterized protein LOC143458971 n=1 Tax=Clavelina lepadiformis TaxID=159417 RepID=UPI004041B6CB
MPAAKYGQLGAFAVDDPNRHYVNIDYLETGNSKYGTCYNNDWNQRGTASFAREPSQVSSGFNEWIQVRHDVVERHENVGHVTLQPSSMKPNSSDLREDNRSLCDVNGQLMEKRDQHTYNCYPALNAQSGWLTPVNVEDSKQQTAFFYRSDFNYENYPLCTKFQNTSTVDCAPRFCCSTKPNENNLRSKSEYFTTSSGEPADNYLRSYSNSMTNSRICTEQPKSSMDGVSQVDLAIQHCREAEARQLDLRRRDYANVSPHFTKTKPGAKTFIDRDTAVLKTGRAEQTDEVFEKENMIKSMKPVKTTSVAKLNSQIQSLRQEMLELRSTTITFKEHMEKMFEDLKIISRMSSDHGKSPWLSPDSHHGITRHHPSYATSEKSLTPINVVPILKTPVVNRDAVDGFVRDRSSPVNSYNSSGRDSSSDSNATIVHNDSSRTLVQHNYENLNSSEWGGEFLCGPKMSPEQMEVITKRAKSNERPNSDSCIDSDQIFTSKRAGPPMSTMSLPHSQSTNKGSKKGDGVKESDERILPVLSKSNAALHISECSIDSGYQGSSVTSPRDKLGRELASQAVTPASPISEFPLKTEEMTDAMSDTATKHVGGLCTNNKIPQCLNNRLLSETELARDDSVQSGPCSANNTSDESFDVFTPQQKRNAQNFNFSGGSVPVQIIRLKSPEESCYRGTAAKVPNDVFPKPRSARNSTDSETTSAVPPRPVPKQRTVFSSKTSESAHPPKPGSEESIAISNDETVPKSLYVDSLSAAGKAILEQPDTDERSREMNQKSELKNEGSKAVTVVAVNKQERPTPTQCLTVIKQSPLTPVEQGSPLPNRVKLGISAISLQPSPKTSRKEAIFYCTRKVQGKAVDASSRIRKTTNAKQLLREKFAAVVENSAAAKRAADGESSDSESSMVRRRSMRMMTEFQIFDFKDCNLNSSTEAKTAHLLSPATPDSNYSPSPSAASVSKQIFDLDKNLVSKSSKTVEVVKCVPEKPAPRVEKQPAKIIKNAAKMNHYEKLQLPAYAAKPLPPPPISPPRSPPIVADTPPSLLASQESLFSEVDLVPQAPAQRPTALFLAPLIKPKASLPGVPCDVANPPAMQKPTLNGLSQRSPTRKSAFTPVMSASLKHLPKKQSPITDRYDVPFKPNRKDDEFNPSEFKRRVSLPLAAVSNRQKFLNELSQKSDSKDEELNDFKRQSSLRVPRKKDMIQPPVWSEKPSSQKPNPLLNRSTKSNRDGERTRDDHSSKSSKSVQDSRRQAPSDKGKTSRKPGLTDLENQPLKFDRSEKLSDVVGALKTAGYLRNGHAENSSKQVSSTSSLGSNKNQTKENKRPQAAVHSLSRSMKIGTNTSNLRKTRSQEKHHYETVEDVDFERKSVNERDDRYRIQASGSSKRSISLDSAPEPASPFRHKSTVALLRASIMGKRDKGPKGSSSENKKDNSSKSGAKTGSKKDQKISSKDGKSKESRDKSSDSRGGGKKSKQETKLHSKDKSPRKHSRDNSKAISLKTIREQGLDSPVVPNSPVLPDAGPRLPGNPDVEVMERFLAAAAASHTVRSPLQRLRSSFRGPRNKTKLLQAARYKDDMDVSGANSSPFVSSRNDKGMPPKQDQFTYV